MQSLFWRLSALLLVTTAASAEPRALLLRDAVSLAVGQNPVLALAQANVEAARGEVLSARGLDDPLLLANVGLEHTTRGAGSGAESDVVSAGAGVSLIQPLPIGGRAGLHLEGNYRRAELGAENTRLVPSTSGEYEPALLLSLTQPLLRGMGVGVARADRRRSQATRDIAHAERRDVAISIVRQVVESYWAVAYAASQLEIQQGAASATRDQLERVRANVEVGKRPASATAEIEVALALREDAVQSAAQLLSERKIALTRLCGLAPGTELTAAQGLPPIGTTHPRSQSETLALALGKHPGLEAARGQTRAAAVELQVAENELLPRLDVEVGGGLIANAASLGEAAEQLRGFGGYTASARLTLELPIVRRVARGATQVARSGVRRGEFTEKNVRAQIAEAVAQAFTRRDRAMRRAQLLAPARKAAELDLASAQASVDSGRGSNFDVLRRQGTLAAMQLRVLSAQFDWNQATTRLEGLTGEILKRHGVALRSGAK